VLDNEIGLKGKRYYSRGFLKGRCWQAINSLSAVEQVDQIGLISLGWTKRLRKQKIET